MRGRGTARRGEAPTRGPIPGSPPRLAINARLVRERDRDRARELARTLALGIAVLLPLLLHVWQQVATMETAYRAESLRAERDRLGHRLREVRMERAALESLDRIESEARGRLGLIHPAPEEVITVLPAADLARSPEPEPTILAAAGGSGG